LGGSADSLDLFPDQALRDLVHGSTQRIAKHALHQALGHTIRNAIDHGIAELDDRMRRDLWRIFALFFSE
jgi:hypothetical protein